MRREHGVLIEYSPDAPHEKHLPTLQCCHCGRHWVMQPGSGRRRGYCHLRCNSVTCGTAECSVCVPIEKQLDIAEGTVNPTAVSVSRGGIIIPGEVYAPGL